MNNPNQNTGHGHVFPRPDGRLARCGGPGICKECALDLSRKMSAKAEARAVTSGLTFAQLREANRLRLPLFKNKHGQPAHSTPDGSDWSDAQWLQALVGEVGEYANLRKKYDRGDIDLTTFTAEAGKELADIQTYLDILAFRLGIDLGQATIDKFNEVSKRVGCDVWLGSTKEVIR